MQYKLIEYKEDRHKTRKFEALLIEITVCMTENFFLFIKRKKPDIITGEYL